MLLGIIIIILLGAVIGFPPIFLYFDIKVRRGPMEHLFLRGLFGGLILWLAIACVLLIDGKSGALGVLSGEGGIIFLILFPFSLIGFLSSGVCLAWLYRGRNKPLLFKKGT